MKMLLDGEWVERDAVIEVTDPQDGSLVDSVPRASVEDMRAAIAAATQVEDRARQAPVHERMSWLHGAAERIAGRHEELARTIAREGIKTIREARAEVDRCVQTLRLSAEEARRLGGEVLRFDQAEGGEGRSGYWTREPVGIVAALTPFNDPLNLVAHKVGPALAAGNAVIVKPDSKTPLSALKLAEALHEAGVPRAVLQTLPGPGREIGDALVADSRVRMVSFTGGRETGEAIARRAGLKALAMELGSNSPVIVMPDADLEAAVPACVSGAFWAAGQNCLHVQRLLLHEAIYADFAGRFVAGAEAIAVGDKLDETTDMGPLIDEATAIRVERTVDEAVEAGARLLTGGRRNGTFYDPTVLERVPDGCDLSREEIYGPVTALYEVASLEQAIERANSVDLGLQAAIFTRDIDTARRAATELRCGGVMINDSTDYRLDAMPFGGVKGSGLGREGVRFAVEEMTELKVVCFRHAD